MTCLRGSWECIRYVRVQIRLELEFRARAFLNFYFLHLREVLLLTFERFQIQHSI